MRLRYLFLSLFFYGGLTAQDIHFSQFLKAPLELSPALTAASDWDVRMGANWRQQWASVPVKYQTFGAFYDQKMDVKWLRRGYLGLGGSFIHDQAGDSELSWTQIGLRVAYHYPIDRELMLSGGINIDVGQRAFRSDQLQFADQYNGEFFDPGQSSNEQFAQQSGGYASQGVGVNLRRKFWQSRSVMNVGFSLNHLNKPSIRFFDENVLELPVLLTSYTSGVFELSNEWDVKTQAYWAHQGAYYEVMAGGGGRYHLDMDGEDLMLGIGAQYRWKDALILQLEGSYQQWHWGLSYDINVSDFTIATQGRGGLELAVHYYLLKAKPPEDFKSCPVF